MLHYKDRNHQRRQPLKYRSGDEKAKSVVIYASTVALDDDSRRLINRGQVLCKITSGTGADKYGPYAKTAGDGRESLTEDAVVVTTQGIDVTLGDRPIAGWFMDCVFDKSELTTGGVSLHGASLTSLEGALSHCIFDD
jgi:hypothetical protein